ncbi:hypothetical protein HZS_1796 [Henneguya salminicola]|uniref:Pyridoxal kinase n=1 Tax=Henneguya salminicola TaxID=69463 RepID=A0A6G3MF55_HENSL|nr:hypothetical protein HZS_1796 [Henneguya salminicola]
MYVPEELIAIYRNKLFPLADVITPNQCEAQWLSQSTISDENDVKNIIKILHQMGPKTVIITSVDNKNQSDIMKCYSSYISENENSHINFEYNIQKINFTFSGTGDACSALLLASLDHFKDIQVIF